MKLLGMFFTLCVGLAVLRAAIQMIVLACLGALLIAAIVAPIETLAGLATVMLLGLVMTYPLIGLPLLVALVICGKHNSQA